MCTHDQEYGDPALMAGLAAAAAGLRREMTAASVERAAQAAQAALPDGNPWTRSVARGLLLVVELQRDGSFDAARDLLEGELARSLPDDVRA